VIVPTVCLKLLTPAARWLVAAAGITVATASVARAQPAPDAGAAKRGELFVAPLPVVNPTIENGLALVGGYVYRLDPADATTAPSLSGAGGFKTSNGSWAAAVLQTLHPAHDAVRVRGIVAYADVNYEFFGIGEAAGNAGQSIGLNQVGPAGIAEALVRVHGNWYVGARYQLIDMRVTTEAVPTPDGPTLPADDGNVRTAALGPRLEYDSRDSIFYPRRGAQLQGVASLFGEAVGGQRVYQVYQAWLNRYHAVGTRGVLAWHAAACGAAGDVTFYDLCLLGRSQDLRGYTVGQYRDRAMIAAQAEWRTDVWWRFGAVAFVGAGAIAPGFDSLAFKDMLPGGGGGVRFTVAKRNHVNIRADYAWGKQSSALYVGVAEAF